MPRSWRPWSAGPCAPRSSTRRSPATRARRCWSTGCGAWGEPRAGAAQGRPPGRGRARQGQAGAAGRPPGTPPRAGPPAAPAPARPAHRAALPAPQRDPTLGHRGRGAAGHRVRLVAGGGPVPAGRADRARRRRLTGADRPDLRPPILITGGAMLTLLPAVDVADGQAVRLLQGAAG